MPKLPSIADLFKNSTPAIDKAGVPFITKKDIDLHRAITKPEVIAQFDDINFQCMALMDRRAKYMVGEFDIHNDDYLLELGEPLIKAGYYGRVWIIKSEEVMQQEIRLAESDAYKDSILEHKLYRGNPFRLFEFSTIKDGKYYYRSLLTGIDGFELNPQDLISISNDDGQTYYMGWKINMDYLAGRVRVDESFKAASKTVSVIIRNKDNFIDESSQIENPSIFFKTYRETGGTALEQNIYQEMPLLETIRVKDLMDINEEKFKKASTLLGFTSNSNEKRERLTVAENYKDLRQITNIQDAHLKNLKVFEKKLKERGGVDESCRIEIAGLTFAQGLPNMAEEMNPQAAPEPAPIEKPQENG